MTARYNSVREMRRATRIDRADYDLLRRIARHMRFRLVSPDGDLISSTMEHMYLIVRYSGVPDERSGLLRRIDDILDGNRSVAYQLIWEVGP